MSTANMSIDPSKARAITDYLAANPDASNRDAAATLGVHESAVRRAKSARGVMVEISLSVIRTDGGTQFREAINEDVAIEYAEAYKAGDRLPAPVAFEDGNGDIWLGDGFTRVRAAGLAGLDRLEFELRKGSLDDAILYAAGANERHGQRRTKADRHRAIEAALKLLPGATQHEIARVCNVSPSLVSLVKNRIDPKFELKPDPLPPENQFIQNDKLVETHKPAKDQAELPMRDEDIDPDEVAYAIESAVGYGDFIKEENKVWDVALADGLDDESGIEVEETTPDGGPIDEFAVWLASLPLNGKLQADRLTKFNHDVNQYWEFTKHAAFRAFSEHVAKFLKLKTDSVTRTAVERFRYNLKHPREWMLCSNCSGAGCQSCHGRGYHA